MKTRMMAVTGLAAMLLAAGGTAQAGTMVYWTEYPIEPWLPDVPVTPETAGKVWRANADGTAKELLINFYSVNSESRPVNIDLDIANNQMYVGTRVEPSTPSGGVWRAGMDGASPTFIRPIPGPGYLAGAVDLDLVNGHMYYAASYGTVYTNGFYRANLDGTGSYQLAVSAQGATPLLGGLEVDPVNEKIYFASNQGSGGRGRGGIWRMNYDGTGAERIHMATIAADVALDVDGGYMYFTDNDTNSIHRAWLDGTHFETLYTAADGVSDPIGLALQLDEGMIYWANYLGGSISRAPMDGTGTVEDILTGLGGRPGYIAVTPEPATLSLLALGGLAIIRRRRTA